MYAIFSSANWKLSLSDSFGIKDFFCVKRRLWSIRQRKPVGFVKSSGAIVFPKYPQKHFGISVFLDIFQNSIFQNSSESLPTLFSVITLVGRKFVAHLHPAGAFTPDQECTCWMSIRFSRFVRFLPSLTNWEIFFDLYEVFLRFFKKIFSTTFQG